MEITRIIRESCPSARFVGKKYDGAANWEEWWANGWFDILEKLSRLPINDNGYIEAIHTVNDSPEHWLGMFFPPNTAVPEPFQFVDIPALDYAVCYLYGSPETGELFDRTAHEQCLAALQEQGMYPKETGWCFQRCNCPRFTEPDEQGNVVLDYGIAIKNSGAKPDPAVIFEQYEKVIGFTDPR